MQIPTIDFYPGVEALAVAGAYQSQTSIRAVFDSHCRSLKIDHTRLRLIRQYDTAFITKNSEHVNFFGSALLGVYPVRWGDSDRDQWFDDILEIDEVALGDDVHELPTINITHRVASDLVNLSFIYLLHRIYNAPGISDRDKHDGMVSVLRIMHYKFVSSLLSHYFPYPADPAIAKAAYAALSLKFDIRKYGSWGALITARAQDIIAGIHRETYKNMRDDNSVLYMVTDIQTRIREVVKAQTSVFHDVKNSNGRVISTSTVMQLDEGVVIKDTKRSFNVYGRYLREISPDPRNFIRDELVKIITDSTPSANPKVFQQVLTYYCANFTDSKKPHVVEFADETLLYTFEFISQKQIKLNDLIAVLSKLKAMYVGSRINDDRILSLRAIGDQIVREAANRKTTVPTAPERTALLLYVTLRALTMKHYK